MHHLALGQRHASPGAGDKPVPGCCTHAACLTITRAAQLVVRVAAVLDQVLHIAMFNLCRLCTAPVCRQRMLSWPRGLSLGHHPHLWQVPPHSCPAPCLLPAKLPLASSEPQCSHLCPGRYLWRLQSPARSRPGQQSAALQAYREERARSAEGPYPLLPVCRLHQDHCPVQAHALSLGAASPRGQRADPTPPRLPIGHSLEKLPGPDPDPAAVEDKAAVLGPRAFPSPT